CTGHSTWIGMLDDIPAVYDTPYILLHQAIGTLKDFLIARFPATAHQYRDITGNFHHTMIIIYIIGGIGLNDIRTQLHTLPDQRNDFFRVTVDHIATGFAVWAEYQGLYHQRNAIALGFGLYL